jgi:hypothetical protein
LRKSKKSKITFVEPKSISGSFVLILERLLALSLSQNNFTSTLPVEFIGLKNLISLNLSLISPNLSSNHFSGSLPPPNQAYLKVLDVSNNNLSGALPWTKTLSLFKLTSFSKNPYLCGEIIHKECSYHHHHHHARSMLNLIIIIVIFAITCIAIFAIIVMKKKKEEVW